MLKIMRISLALLVVTNEFKFICSSLESTACAETPVTRATDQIFARNHLNSPKRLIDSQRKTCSRNTTTSNFQGINQLAQVGSLNLSVRHDLYTVDQLNLAYQISEDLNYDQFGNKLTISELSLATLLARSHSLVYNDYFMHRFENHRELKESFGPHVDNGLCLEQLKQLNGRLDTLERQTSSSTDLNLYQLLDTYGRALPGLTSGNVLWLGMYESCLQLQIEYDSGKTHSRYCLASLRHKDWPMNTSSLSGLLAFKVGVCLPRACDSQRHKNKFQLIQRLIDSNHGQLNGDQLILEGLYCLPDEDSPMRAWWRAPKALQAVVVFALWFTILIWATLRHETHKASLAANCSEQPVGGAELLAPSELGFGHGEIYRILSIKNNFQLLLFGEAKRSKQKPAKLENEQNSKIVDLRCLDGLKVICSWCVMSGHVFMTRLSLVSNANNHSSAGMLNAFPVNAFFTISAILTCYFQFNTKQWSSLIVRPREWAAHAWRRYLRIMPVYVIVVYYCKYLGKFAGSGPMWDYGTSSMALRRHCEEESWLWTLLFGSNFKPVFEQCIPSAWYLANDFQFFLITPIFFAALQAQPKLGQRLLEACITVSCAAGVLSVLLAEVPDPRSIAKFKPHGFMTYVTFLTPLYTRPYYRIPAYLCGLLLGHKLLVYEQAKRECRAHMLLEKNQTDKERGYKREPDWPRCFLNYGSAISLLILAVYIFVAMVAYRVPLNKFFANVAVAITMPGYNLLFGLSIGLYVLLAATGHGNKLLNGLLEAPLWKPLAKLNLCILLINMEVVNYIAQSSKQQVHLDFFEELARNLLGIAATYPAAAVMYVLFEAPLEALINRLLDAVSRSRLKVKGKVH